MLIWNWINKKYHIATKIEFNIYQSIKYCYNWLAIYHTFRLFIKLFLELTWLDVFVVSMFLKGISSNLSWVSAAKTMSLRVKFHQLLRLILSRCKTPYRSKREEARERGSLYWWARTWTSGKKGKKNKKQKTE